MINKICADVMKSIRMVNSMNSFIQVVEGVQEDILQPKQFHTTRFVCSQLCLCETVLRNWKTLCV